MTAATATDPVRTRRQRGPRLTIRARLTLTYAVMITSIGAVMLGIVYIFMRYIPTYQISALAPLDNAATEPVPTVTPTGIRTDSYTATASTLQIRSEADVLNTLLAVSIVVLVVLAAAGAVIGWIVAGRVLRPLQAINAAAQLAGTGTFDHRVGSTGPHDEVRELSDTFDEMLGKLDRAFQANRRFAANASHELRTPLAATQTVLEVALSDPALDLRALREAAERVYETNRRNIEAVDSLLSLAEIGSGAVRPEPTDLAVIVREGLDDAAASAGARRLEVRRELGAAPLLGDPALLHRAVANLLTNAVVHNRDGGSIGIATSLAPDGSVEVRVENTGPELDPALVGSLVEPFVRGSGRVQSPSAPRGHGLGLAIVQGVAEAHGGTLELIARAGGGLLATLRLPSAPAVEEVSGRRASLPAAV
ncbi:HAMP domain-containing sensor histidine kinase [Leifsonia aquatica]|uniref:HAMP domain-containing sensor histidine kinase n=1 Tax=Leifsonia aquatica TaxID=144185 RepID=UPI0004691140|nr:HAMP domain-containing sensor histidine kinase [Leifsonia aquatica]